MESIRTHDVPSGSDGLRTTAQSFGRSRSRYKPAVLHPDAATVLTRLDGRLRRLLALSVPLAVAAGCLGFVAVGAQAVTTPTVGHVLWLWVGLLAIAALWHCLPPAFAAPDLYWRMAGSIDPLEPATERDEQVLRMTRFGLVVASAWVLVANDLVREARLRFYDSITMDSVSPELRGAVETARASANSYWTNVSLVVLGAAIALGVGRRLHAVDRASYARCPALRTQSQWAVGWYVVLAAIGLGLVVGGAYIAAPLFG